MRWQCAPRGYGCRCRRGVSRLLAAACSSPLASLRTCSSPPRPATSAKPSRLRVPQGERSTAGTRIRRRLKDRWPSRRSPLSWPLDSIPRDRPTTIQPLTLAAKLGPFTALALLSLAVACNTTAAPGGPEGSEATPPTPTTELGAAERLAPAAPATPTPSATPTVAAVSAMPTATPALEAQTAAAPPGFSLHLEGKRITGPSFGTIEATFSISPAPSLPEARYPEGQAVELVVVAQPDSRFIRWTGACLSQPTGERRAPVRSGHVSDGASRGPG